MFRRHRRWVETADGRNDGRHGQEDAGTEIVMAIEGTSGRRGNGVGGGCWHCGDGAMGCRSALVAQGIGRRLLGVDRQFLVGLADTRGSRATGSATVVFGGGGMTNLAALFRRWRMGGRWHHSLGLVCGSSGQD